MSFLSEDFLLNSKTAKWLYHEVAAKLPIIDYHCHLNPCEIAENIRFSNLTQAWLSGDHYKWRAMRMSGVEEKFITGDALDKEKFMAFAECMPGLIGNPIYHWCHMELKRYCNIEEALLPESAERIWENSAQKLKKLSVREIMKMSKVETICTTDDPADDLKYHKLIDSDKEFQVRVLPAFRPDKALNIENPSWCEYINVLSSASDINISNISTLKAALAARMDAFAELGCRAADHGLNDVTFALHSQRAETAFVKAINNQPLSSNEISSFRTELLLFCAQEYFKRNWVMEIHYGAIRNVNDEGFKALGADTGFDIIGQPKAICGLSQFFNLLQQHNQLPKVLLFSLTPNDNAALCTLSGAFGPKIQQGSAWWFNDTKNGMIEQIKTYAELLPLGSFVGFLTDSRSYLSYTRHEYFRRILCSMIGQLVEAGEYPNHKANLTKLVKDISYMNAKKFFNL